MEMGPNKPDYQLLMKDEMETKPKPKLMDEYQAVLRRKHYALSTERTYSHWVRRFLMHLGYQGRDEIDWQDVGGFLTYLAVVKKVSPTTQNQALCALVFLFKRVLKEDVYELKFEWAKRKKSLPVVLTQGEVAHLLRYLRGEKRLIVQLLYGCGLRLNEALRLRVKDVDMGQVKVILREAKHGGDRYVPLPENLIEPLRLQIAFVEQQHHEDLALGYGSVELPHAMDRKYPNAPYELIWQYVFPAHRISKDPRSGVERRHHLFPTGIQRAVRAAAKEAGIRKHVKTHTFRHSYATHLVERGVPIEKVQALLGHKDIKTTMIYIHTATHDVRSPLDDLVELDINNTLCVDE